MVARGPGVRTGTSPKPLWKVSEVPRSAQTFSVASSSRVYHANCACRPRLASSVLLSQERSASPCAKSGSFVFSRMPSSRHIDATILYGLSELRGLAGLELLEPRKLAGRIKLWHRTKVFAWTAVAASNEETTFSFYCVSFRSPYCSDL